MRRAQARTRRDPVSVEVLRELWWTFQDRDPPRTGTPYLRTGAEVYFGVSEPKLDAAEALADGLEEHHYLHVANALRRVVRSVRPRILRAMSRVFFRLNAGCSI